MKKVIIILNFILSYSVKFEMDAKLLESLTKASESLSKRPGRVSVDAVKKLASFYGFDTWLEKLDTELGIVSLSNTPKTVMSPLNTSLIASPLQGNRIRGKSVILNETEKSRLTLNLDRVVIDIDFTSPGTITNVSVSVGTESEINSLKFDFIKGWNGSLTAGDVLLNNLTKNETLDQFNMNLRVLYMMDRLSKQSPNDIFTIFNYIVDGLLKENKISKIGDLLSNYNNKVGVFLNYWEDDYRVNEWIRRNKNLEINGDNYLIHFKIKESSSSKDFKINEEYLIDSKIPNSNESGWFINNKWQIPNDLNVIETLSIIQLELCPTVWIPQDLLDLLSLRYKIIDQTNKNWGYNTKSLTKNDQMDEFYSKVNEYGYISLGKINVSFTIGCKMIKLFKIQGLDLSKFTHLIKILRSWIKLNSILSKLVKLNGGINDIKFKVENVSLDDLRDEEMIEIEEFQWINVSLGDLKNGEIKIESNNLNFNIINGISSDEKIEISESFFMSKN